MNYRKKKKRGTRAAFFHNHNQQKLDILLVQLETLHDCVRRMIRSEVITGRNMMKLCSLSFFSVLASLIVCQHERDSPQLDIYILCFVVMSFTAYLFHQEYEKAGSQIPDQSLMQRKQRIAAQYATITGRKFLFSSKVKTLKQFLTEIKDAHNMIRSIPKTHAMKSRIVEVKSSFSFSK